MLKHLTILALLTLAGCGGKVSTQAQLHGNPTAPYASHSVTVAYGVSL